MEVVLAVFVLVKLRISRIFVDLNRTRSTDDDFAKLIALVALMFSRSNLVDLIDVVQRLETNDELEASESRWAYWSLVAIVSNSTMNLIVYLVASRNFRAAFLSFGKTVKEELFSK